MRSRWLVSMAVVSLALAAVLALSLWSGQPSLRPGSRVVVVGDSLTAYARTPLLEALTADGWKPVVKGVPGARIPGGGFELVDWPAEVQRLVRFADPEVAVVELGTNGCMCPSIGGAIDAVMQPLRELRAVYWLNVRIASPDPARALEINTELEAATRRWPNLSIIDMETYFFERPELIGPDDIHFTDAGSIAFSTLIAAALREQLASVSE